MADISSIERRKLERLLRMVSGHVFDFSDQTFSEFFEEHTRRDIDAAVYRERRSSKANRLGAFWAVEGNHPVGKVNQVVGDNCLRRRVACGGRIDSSDLLPESACCLT